MSVAVIEHFTFNCWRRHGSYAVETIAEPSTVCIQKNQLLHPLKFQILIFPSQTLNLVLVIEEVW